MLNSLYQSLDPVAFALGPFEVRWYGLAYLMGFVCAALVIYKTARRWRLPLTIDELLVLMVGVAFGVIVGARVFYILFYNLEYYLANPASILRFDEGGMSFHGGLAGALLGGFIACRYLRLSFVTVCDLACIGAPLGLFFGRCANFINGELWGAPTDMPWGVVFETGGDVARHPSQLYEALLEGLVLFAVLWILSFKRPTLYQGTFLGVFCIGYGVFRFLVEFVRVPDAQLGYLFGFVTMGQLLTIPLLIIGAGLVVWAARSKRPQRLYVQ